ncbi:hypothetical protein B0E33_01305 [Roseibium algicola]|uniref:Uncharacterized protein n=1 Tax=Roseibium algicola TaxID=2857014 RepID=A0ABN4WQG2_9HYPH|nr:hypothetical protein [Roseibium aggregatum]AQQ02392.1 hypothetical protein B0E33_01305 [Roseibium aggregatum]
MKMDRNINEGGYGKYALIKLRKLTDFIDPSDPFQKVNKDIADALELLEENGILDRGLVGTEAEFMVIRLKDKYAAAALEAYADAAEKDDPEWAAEIREMIPRAGENSPWCKRPD